MKKKDTIKLNVNGIKDKFTPIEELLAFKPGSSKPYLVYKSEGIYDNMGFIGVYCVILDYDNKVMSAFHSLNQPRNGKDDSSDFELEYKRAEDELKLFIDRQNAFKHFKSINNE